MATLFGTDGIRGVANVDISAELAVKVGRAVARAAREGILGHAHPRPRVLIGRDTRPSGPMIESAVAAGVCSGGADALLGGVLPSPGVAFALAEGAADVGVVVSASHNPAPDNGIKLFGPGGWKLSEDAEGAIEGLLEAEPEPPTGTEVGVVQDAERIAEAYTDHLVGAVPEGLAGLRVLLDCAHGAAASFAPPVFERLGAEPIVLNAPADGSRINEGCGATHPQVLAEASKANGAIGLTFDGDADRVLAADEEGGAISGDAIIAMLAADLRGKGELVDDAIVVTVMANQALRRWCSDARIRLVETPVGDRNVVAAMRAEGIVLGGEQSGHVILAEEATTGDGILVALRLCDLVSRSGRRLAELVPFRPFPQVLVNVATQDGERLSEADEVWDTVSEHEDRLGDDGRILVRPSGTEPVIRIMVEASDEGRARRIADEIAAAVARSMDARPVRAPEGA